MRTRLLFLSSVLLISMTSSAQTTAEPAYANMQRAVGGIIQQVAVSRGYSTADPRTYSTLYSFGKSAAGTVAGAGAGVVIVGTAPGWLSVIAAAAVAAAVGYAVNAGIDGLVKFIFPGGGAVVVFLPPSGVTYSQSDVWSNSAPADSTGCPINPATGMADGIMGFAGQLVGSCYSIPSAAYNQRVCVSSAVQSALGGSSCSAATSSSLAAVASVLGANGWTDTSASSAPAGQPTQTTVPSLASAVSMIPAAELAQPVDYGTMAAMINEIWQQAAQQPGYAGLPYVASTPVQAADVQAWAAANPNAYPTVQDLVAPVTDTATGFAPSVSSSTGTALQPATQPTASTATNPTANGDSVNFGPDPGIGSPQLEATPTAAQILAPVMSLLPDLRSYTVPGHAGTCPTPSFSAWGSSFTLTEHCVLAEQFRTSFYVAGILVFALASLFILLTA